MITALLALIPALACAAAIADRPGRRRTVAMAVAAATAAMLIVADQWNAAQVVELRNSPLQLIPGLIGAGLVAIAGAVLIRRRPAALAVLVVLALPFRIPVGVGGTDANLLLPLYLVMAAGVIAAIWREFQPEQESAREPGEGPAPGPVARWFRPLLALAVLTYALGILYSEDRSAGLLHLCFFLVPFGVVFALVTEIRWSRARLTLITAVILGMALLCALVGLVEWATETLLWNEAVIRSNDFHVYFRVNSLFWDPNVFGRYLALAITIAAAALIWARDGRTIIRLAACSVVLWVALLTTYSQSSFIALLAGLAALAALRWSVKWVAGGVLVLAAAVLAFGTFAGGVVKLDLGALNKQTSGRANLVEGGIDLFESRPVFGYGSGAFSASFRRVVADGRAPVTESHTEPVTVAAERGVVGLLLYLGLIATALTALTAGFRRVMPGLGGPFDREDPDRGPPVARAAIFAAFVAVLAHTLTYAGFLDDPVTWVLLAIGYSLAFQCREIGRNDVPKV
ncbi:MAG: O-antigen ligase family protein [Solirubrobacterales bacterium]|nr:O-antigen ligase family protein [Solirubrobacterales bacterium]